jgi:hypothetical protein
MKRPAFQFYPGDWLHDSGLRSCSLAARGLWIDVMSLMHQAHPYGYLTYPSSKDGAEDQQKDILHPILPASLARMVGATPHQTQKLLKELEAAGVFSRKDGVIFSRRMIRDEVVRESRAQGGSLSSENPNVPRRKDGPQQATRISLQPSPSSSSSSSSSSKVKSKSKSKREFVPPTLEEVSAYCREQGLNVDPEHWLDTNMAKGFLIGKTQTPMKDWKASLRTWNRNEVNNGKPNINRAEKRTQSNIDALNAEFPMGR